MAFVFNEAGISDVAIGGFNDLVPTLEHFQREYDYVDSDGTVRDFTDISVDSAIVYDPLTLATVATIVTSFAGDPTLGKLVLTIDNDDVPAAGEYQYRCRFTDDSNPPRRTIQQGRFTVAASPV